MSNYYSDTPTNVSGATRKKTTTEAWLEEIDLIQKIIIGNSVALADIANRFYGPTPVPDIPADPGDPLPETVEQKMALQLRALREAAENLAANVNRLKDL